MDEGLKILFQLIKGGNTKSLRLHITYEMLNDLGFGQPDHNFDPILRQIMNALTSLSRGEELLNNGEPRYKD